MTATISTALTGLHARAEETIQATQDWERGRIDHATLERAFKADSDAIVKVQKEAGVEFASDGQLNLSWQDLFRPVSTGFSGLKPGAMVRWFNTNTFYFTPVVSGEIATKGTALWNAIESRFVKANNFKVIIPDPFTFAELAEDDFYRNKEKLLFAYAEAIREELAYLQRQGVKYVQFSSPALVARFTGKPLTGPEVEQAGEALRSALRGIGLRSGFHTYFGDASRHVSKLLDAIPTDDIGFDFTQTDIASLSRTNKGVIAGLVDSRTTYLEPLDDLRAKLRDIVDRTGTKSVTVSPSADLRYIPRVSADRKVKLLGSLRRAGE